MLRVGAGHTDAFLCPEYDAKYDTPGDAAIWSPRFHRDLYSLPGIADPHINKIGHSNHGTGSTLD
jgi:hypothetical protein